MILDELNEFADAVAIPASAGTANIGDVIDTQVIRDLGNGQAIYFWAQIETAGAGGTSLQLQLVTDDNSALSSPAILLQTAVIALANLTAGKRLVMVALPIEGVAYERYLGVRAVTLGTFSGGTINAGLTLDPNGWKHYPEGVN